jgi:hypothetical protein
MKGGCKTYPNKGVKIDPRAITSAKMPECLKVHCGYLKSGYMFLMWEGIITRSYVESENPQISALLPFCQTKNKLKSSHLFRSDTHLIEFFRTTSFNYKIYALREVFFKSQNHYFQNNE